MGQKVHPYIQRIGLENMEGKRRSWFSLWFAKPKDYGRLIAEDQRVR